MNLGPMIFMHSALCDEMFNVFEILKQTQTLKQVQGDMSTCQLTKDDNPIGFF